MGEYSTELQGYIVEIEKQIFQEAVDLLKVENPLVPVLAAIN